MGVHPYGSFYIFAGIPLIMLVRPVLCSRKSCAVIKHILLMTIPPLIRLWSHSLSLLTSE